MLEKRTASAEHHRKPKHAQQPRLDSLMTPSNKHRMLEASEEAMVG